jgi:hypothetical protein
MFLSYVVALIIIIIILLLLFIYYKIEYFEVRYITVVLVIGHMISTYEL